MIARSMTINEIMDNFSLLDEWDDRYRYLIEIGRALAPLTDRDGVKQQGSGLRQPSMACHVLVRWLREDRSGICGGQRCAYCARADRYFIGLFSGGMPVTSLRRMRFTFERLGLREHLRRHHQWVPPRWSNASALMRMTRFRLAEK